MYFGYVYIVGVKSVVCSIKVCGRGSYKNVYAVILVYGFQYIYCGLIVKFI